MVVYIDYCDEAWYDISIVSYLLAGGRPGTVKNPLNNGAFYFNNSNVYNIAHVDIGCI